MNPSVNFSIYDHEHTMGKKGKEKEEKSPQCKWLAHYSLLKHALLTPGVSLSCHLNFTGKFSILLYNVVLSSFSFVYQQEAKYLMSLGPFIITSGPAPAITLDATPELIPVRSATPVEHMGNPIRLSM